MKKSTIYILFALLAFSLGACEVNKIEFGDFTVVDEDLALVKFNYNIAMRNNPSAVIKVNGVRVTPALTTRYPFPGGGYNTGGGNTADYMSFEPGELNVSVVTYKKLTVLNPVLTDSVEIFSTKINVEGGKNYTLHITDTAANTKTLFTQDDLTRPDTAQAKHRFVNLMPDVPALDLYNGTTLVAANIGYLKMSETFIVSSGGSSVWTTRVAGSGPTGAVVATYTSASTLSTRRVYTAFASGYKAYSGTDARRPFISFFLSK